jgi:MoaA/NifB/PqqE/SkfB family radical SAM enzyme
MSLRPLRRKVIGFRRRYREARMFAKAMHSPYHPILAHIIPIRRCNLSCTYCNEFDSISKPVPTGEMLTRIDKLAELGTTVISLSGGEPLLHPDLDEIIRRIRQHSTLAEILTNGYLLTPDRIERLNRPGLDHLQISIDNVQPDDVSKKSLKVLDQKLRWLAEYAKFHVNINSVVGASIPTPEDARVIARRALELGLTSTVGVIHDHSGQLQPLDGRYRQVFEEIQALRRGTFSFDRHNPFQRNLARGLPNEWSCRAGSRYLYICEDGLVHYCSQQRGYPAIPLAEYRREHLEREYHTTKSCAPFCTVSCVHRVAILDNLRANPRRALGELFPAGSGATLPLPVRILRWAFVPPAPLGRKLVIAKAALRFLGVK